MSVKKNSSGFKKKKKTFTKCVQVHISFKSTVTLFMYVYKTVKVGMTEK